MKRVDRRKLKRWVSKYITPVDIKYDDDFYYSIDTQTVAVSHEIPDHINWYKEFCFSKGLLYDVNDFTLCMLHEIGHDQTLFFISDFKCFIDSIISNFVQTTVTSSKLYWLRCQIYFRLPCEIAATEWAIDFINNNIEAIKELEKLYEVGKN